MYIARFARQDLLRAVGALTTMITRWDALCDRKLFRIIKHISGTVDWRQIGFVGDTTENLQLGLLSDADFAGDRADVKRHIRSVVGLVRPTLLSPLSAQSNQDKRRCHIAPSRPKSWRLTTLFERAGCPRCCYGELC